MEKKSRIILITIGVIILSSAIIITKPSRIINILINIRPAYLFAAIISVLFFYLIQTIRFRALLGEFIKPPSILKIYPVLVSSAIVNLITPGGGGDILLRPYLINKTDKTGYWQVAACVLFERIIDLILLLSFISICTIIILPKYSYLPFVLLIMIQIAFFILINLPLNIFIRIVPKKIMQNIQYIHTLKSIKLKKMIMTLLLSIINLLLMITTVCLTLFSLTGTFDIKIIAIHFISIVIGLFSFIPGGIGVSDISNAGLFHYFGYESALGVSLNIANRIIILAVSLAFFIPTIKRIKKSTIRKIYNRNFKTPVQDT